MSIWCVIESRNCTIIWKNKFHERINELWERAKERNNKTTQTEYARRLGVTRNALLGWLRGTGQPDADGFVRIAMVENVSLTWLLGDERPLSRNELFQDEQKMLQLYWGISSEHKEDIMILASRFQARDAEGCSGIVKNLPSERK